MARSFTAVSSQSLSLTIVPSSGSAYSLMVAFRTTTVSESGIVFASRSASNANSILWQIDHNNSDLRLIVRDNSGSIAVATLSAALSINTWYRVLAVRNGSDLSIWANGGTAATASATFSDIDTTRIEVAGTVAGTSTVTSFFDGSIAEAALVSGALSQKHADAFAAGFAPSLISQNLVHYWPLQQDDGGGNRVSRVHPMTAINSPTYTTHPRVIYPQGVF